MENTEKISALMDGEATEGESRVAFAALMHDEADEAWRTYHLIGDTLRGDAAVGTSAGFNRRFRERLEEEPTVLAPRKSLLRNVQEHAWSVAASLAAIAVVGWMVLGDNPLRPSDNQLAGQMQPVTLAQAPQAAPVSANPRQLSPYLLAHQEYAAGSPMQGAAYIRLVAATEGADR
ncbi:MAG: sigma-E factor negative regulatory protein [Pseudomonadota bacterium]